MRHLSVATLYFSYRDEEIIKSLIDKVGKKIMEKSQIDKVGHMICFLKLTNK